MPYPTDTSHNMSSAFLFEQNLAEQGKNSQNDVKYQILKRQKAGAINALALKYLNLVFFRLFTTCRRSAETGRRGQDRFRK